MSELRWIAVPGGSSGPDSPTVLLRLLIMPRLDGASLAAEGLDSWPPPQLRSPLRVVLRVGADAPETSVDLTPRLGDQPGVWSAFFSAATVSPRPSAAGDRVIVDPTTDHASSIGATYSATAATVTGSDKPGEADHLRQQADQQLADRWSDPAPTPTSAGTVRPPVDPSDFGTIVASLREFPSVLQALGLIVELDVPRSALPVGAEAQIRMDWLDGAASPSPLPEVMSFWTCFEPSTFLPTGAADLLSGMVRLDDPQWSVITVDVDAAVGRLRGAAGGDVSAGSLPALRTAGMSLARSDRQASFDARRTALAEAALAPAEPPPLTAADLVLGYRIDVTQAGSGTWHPLCRRTTTLTVKGEAGPALTIGTPGMQDEGHVKAHAAVRDELGGLRSDQIVTRWSGWSLAVPDPRYPSTSTRPATSYTFDWTFEVPDGTLLPLRFGARYQFRARVADVAGGGLAFDDETADRNRTAAKRYGRHEPVLPPVTAFPDGALTGITGAGDVDVAAAPRPGVRVDQLVVRSAGGTAHPPAQPSEPVEVQRSVTPSPGSVDLAMQHGVLTGTSAATWSVLAPFVQAGTPVPDCASAGVAAYLRPGPDGPASATETDDWRPAWPALGGKQVRLRERRSGDHVTPTMHWRSEQLVVTLAPAEQVVIELSSTLPTPSLDPRAHTSIDLEHFDLVDAVSSGDAPDAVLGGRHPMITPARTLTCVHAVMRPLRDPAGSLTATRNEGEVVAILVPTGILGIDPASTAQVDLTATWTEIDDDRSTPVADFPVQSVTVHRGDTAFAETLRHHFRDTRHREVDYTITAVSRFREFFDDSVPAEQFLAPTTLPQTVRVLSSARPAPPVVRSVVPAFSWSETTTGGVITRQRLGGRVRVELARPWFTTGAGEQLAVVVAPGDGDPDPSVWPSLTQVGRDPVWTTWGAGGYREITTPAHWQEIGDPDAGNSHKVWVPASTDRTWVPGAPTPRWPRLTAVSSATAHETLVLPGRAAVTGADQPTSTVDVAAHEVWLAGDSWYADIAIDHVSDLSYCPLVQLALGRFQPHSIDGLLLSNLVRTDFVPLLPDRTLTVDQVSSPGEVVVTLTGFSPHNRVDILVEHGLGGPDALIAVGPGGPTDGDGAWSVVGGNVSSGLLNEPITVPLPTTGPLRVRVREVEAPPGALIPGAGSADELAERVVFTDVVALA